MAVQVRLNSAQKQREMTKFCVFSRTRPTAANFKFDVGSFLPRFSPVLRFSSLHKNLNWTRIEDQHDKQPKLMWPSTLNILILITFNIFPAKTE